MDPVLELEKVAKSISGFNEKLGQETYSVVQELHRDKLVREIDNAIDEVEDLGDDMIEDVDGTIADLEDVQDNTAEKVDETLEDLADAAESLERRASLIDKGSKVVCVTPCQNLYKGRKYIVTEKIEPAFLVIAEEDGQEPIGIFKTHRFLIWTEAV